MLKFGKTDGFIVDIKTLEKIFESHARWVEHYTQGKRANLSGEDLRDCDFKSLNLDLSYADLSGADLRDLDLRRIKLKGANLDHANLRNTNLRDSDLSRANLNYVNASGACFMDADLNDASLHKTNFTDTELYHANLKDAKFHGAIGNGREIKSLFIDCYPIAYTATMLQIGCQLHPIEVWWDFDDETIESMDEEIGLDFWHKYKDWLKQTIALSPADPT